MSSVVKVMAHVLDDLTQAEIDAMDPRETWLFWGNTAADATALEADTLQGCQVC